MEHVIDNFFMQIPEPQQSALLYLRNYFVEEQKLQECWKYNTPFYFYKEKWFCYISYSKKRNHEIYLGFVKGYKVEHKKLEAEGRKQIKVYRINPDEDIRIKELNKIIALLKKLY